MNVMVGRKEMDVEGTSVIEAELNHMTILENGVVGFNERDNVDCKINCSRGQTFITFNDYNDDGAVVSFISPTQHMPLLASVVGSIDYLEHAGSNRRKVCAEAEDSDVDMRVTGYRCSQTLAVNEYKGHPGAQDINILLESRLRRGVAFTALPYRFEQWVSMPAYYIPVFHSSLACIVMGLLDKQIPGTKPVRTD
jgi:hypothetical protein